MKIELGQVSRFLSVGGLIFIVDGLVLFTLINAFSLPPLVSRIVSCTVALMAAFYLHARFTFLVSPSRGTLFRYLVSQSLSAGLNFFGVRGLVSVRIFLSSAANWSDYWIHLSYDFQLLR